MLILKIKKIRPLKNLLSSRLFQLGCVSVFIFLLAPPAYAEEANTPTMISLATMLFYILNLVINAIAGLATAMDLIFSVEITGINGQSIQVVQTTWALVRNFSNMFFILGLIIMAFATIFDVSRYNFRTLIVRFLIVALLINFSLTIGETIIDWTQSLSSVFLTAMGSYGNLLGGPLDPAMLLGEPSGILGSIRPFLYRLGGVSGAAGVFLTFAADSNLFAQVTQMFFSIILGSIIAFSLLVGVIFTAIRIPILWALLILAPAAWVCSIFPPLADANRNWWKHFLGWNFFLPIYLFFLYVGMLFLQAQSNITTPILPAGATDPLTGLGFSFQTIFFYGFVAMFMISGVKFAMKGGQYFGTSGVAAAIWAKGRATARYAGALPYRGVSAGVGAAWRGTGAEGVYKDTKQTFKEQGFAGFEATEKTLGKLYQGQQGRDKAAAWLGEKTGLAPGLAEKQLARNIDLEKAKLKERRVGEVELRTMIRTSKNPEQKIAAMQRLQEEFNKSPDSSQVLDLVKSLGTSIKTEVGAKTLRQIKWSDMTADELNVLLADPAMSDPNIQTLIYNALIEKRRIKPNQFNIAIDRASLSGAQRANMVVKARELMSEDMSSSERNALFETLMGLRKDLATGAFVHSATEQARIQSDNKDAIREVLRIRAQKKDSFFNDAAGNPVQSTLHNYAQTYFENPSERRKFLEDVSKKHASSAARTMLDQKLAKDDSGQIIARTGYTDPITGSILTSDEAEKAVTKQVFQKLNLEEKLTQSKAQLAEPILSEVASEEMSRNSSSMQSWVSHDKYQTFNVNTGGRIEKQARDAIFQRQFLRPFMDQVHKLRAEISELEAGQTTPAALKPNELSIVKKALQDNNVGRLRSLRGSYEEMCTKYNMIDSIVIAQNNKMDSIIKRFRDKIASIN